MITQQNDFYNCQTNISKKIMRTILTLFLILMGISVSYGQCTIFDLLVEAHECDDSGAFMIDFEFDYVGVSDSFVVSGNGLVHGVFAYGELFYTVGPFQGDCETDYELVVSDQEVESCQDVVEIGTICCGEELCEIGELVVEVGECNEEGMFFVELDFDFANVESNSFTVAGNGLDYGQFPYSDLPIELGPLAGDCAINYEFIVRDFEDETCSSDIGIGEVCCEMEVCEIGELFVEIGDCNPNDIFYMFLNFEYSGVSELFQVQGNGVVYGQYSYNDLPIELGPFEGDCETEYELVVVDVENEACNSVVELGTICCGEAPCEIGELSVEVGECNDADEFAVFINFEYSGVSDSFRVAGNGNQYGNFAYADLPIEISNLEGNCDLNYEFVVIDLDDETCAADIGIGEVCCGEDDCEISELLIVPTECDDEGEFYAVILFEYEGTSESFSVLGNGNNYGTYEYEDLPIAVGPLDADCDTDYEFVIVDQSQESCIEEYELGTVCCEECEIGEIDVISAECEGEVSFVEIDFDYVGVTDLGFDVFIGDDFYGFFSYETLPLTLEIEGNEAPNYALTICENDRPDCCSTIEVDNPCYTTDVKEIWLDQIKLVHGNEGYYVLNQNSVEVDFNIYAIDGKLIYNDNLGAFAQKAIEVNVIPAGLYIIRFQSGMRYKMDKMIIER